MQQIKFSCTVTNQSSFNDLGIEVWLDDNKFFDNLISTGTHNLMHAFVEDESEHTLKFILKNKTSLHTEISEFGEIISDVLINIENLTFDNINIDQLFYTNAKYAHNSNNTTEPTINPFYGNMGCNGEVTFSFYTPLYLWLLENM